MLEPTRKRHTDDISVTFVGPRTYKDKAIEMMKVLHFVEVSGAVPWREAFPEITPDKEGGYALRGFRYREGITQRELSRRTGIPQRHISEMEHGKRPIGKEMAKRLATVLNVSYMVFL